MEIESIVPLHMFHAAMSDDHQMDGEISNLPENIKYTIHET